LFRAAEIVETDAPAAFATSRMVTWCFAFFRFVLKLLRGMGVLEA
jgi:hypothetical protein